MKRKWFALVVFSLLLAEFVCFIRIRMPEYKVKNSMSFSSGGGIRETDLKVVVYKAHYNPILYDNIAEEHNRINGVPTKLTLHLYNSEAAIRKGRNPYREVVYDYDKGIKYIFLGYIN